MRVPPRLRNRSGYTATAGLGAGAVALAFVAILGAGSWGALVLAGLVAAFAAIAAFFAWPREAERTGSRMFGRGVLVALAVHTGLALLIAASGLDVEMFFAMMLLSVIATLGIPILLAGAVSWLFRSAPESHALREGDIPL